MKMNKNPENEQCVLVIMGTNYGIMIIAQNITKKSSENISTHCCKVVSHIRAHWNKALITFLHRALALSGR